MSEENKSVGEVVQSQANETKLPAAAPIGKKSQAKPSKNQSVYTADQIIDGHRAFGYPKVIVIAAIQTDGKMEYTQAEAKAVIDAFAKRDPLKNK